MSAITKPQLTRLNTVYSQWASRALDASENTRATRIAEVSSRCGRKIASTSQLTLAEAKQAIDSLQAELGIAETAPAQRRTQRDRQKAGTEGRHDQVHAEATMVSAGSIRRIQAELSRLGWTQARLDAFLLSTSSPIGQRKEIRTLGDANRVFWALKHMQPKEAQISA